MFRLRRAILMEIKMRARLLRKSAHWPQWKKGVEWGRILGLCSAAGIKVEEAQETP